VGRKKQILRLARDDRKKKGAAVLRRSKKVRQTVPRHLKTKSRLEAGAAK
jgi:hypothetical protein